MSATEEQKAMAASLGNVIGAEGTMRSEPTEGVAPVEPIQITEQMPRNVVEAIRRVMVELPGIGKATGEQHRRATGSTGGDDAKGITYAYRSIEQITSEAQRLFGKYGVVWVPEVEPPPDAKLAEREFTMGKFDTRWTDTYMTVTYTVYGPGGVDDRIRVGPVMALGRDNSDKGYNKAMTQAFKQCLLQVLCIGDPQDEGEHQRHEQQGFGQEAPPVGQGTEAPFFRQYGYTDADEMESLTESLRDILHAVGPDHKAPLKAWLIEHGYTVTDTHTGEQMANPLPVRKGDVEEYRQILIEARTASSLAAIGVAGEDTVDRRSDATYGPEPAPAPPSAPEPVGEHPAPNPVPEDVVDEIRAEVLTMKTIELSDELRKRSLALGGTKEEKSARLVGAMLTEWLGEHGEAP